MDENFFTEQSEVETGFTVDTNVKLENEKKPKFSLRREAFEWLDVIITAIIAVVIIFSLVFRVATIDGPSMENTFFTGDRVIISNFLYKPQFGDVVVVSRNANNSIEEVSDEPIIKRVIATAGQKVDIDFEKGIVYVDDVALDEPYTKTPTNVNYDLKFPVYVPEGCIFVLGDNRNESLDSRSSDIGNNGMIDTRYVIGRAIVRVFPFDKFGLVK
ncbi:MAG: signal peptidase I [Clostridia bacterium]|nr:signal peptidase I [Clostridia bacterium]